MATSQNGELANVIVCGVMVLDLVLEPKNLIRNLSVPPASVRELFLPFWPFDAIPSKLASDFFSCVRFHKGKIDAKATGT
jgi:hypothetical protein